MLDIAHPEPPQPSEADRARCGVGAARTAPPLGALVLAIVGCRSAPPTTPATTERAADQDTERVVDVDPARFSAASAQIDGAERWTLSPVPPFVGPTIELAIPIWMTGDSFTGPMLTGVRSCDNEWDREFAVVANALLPFSELVLHVGSDPFCAGASYFDVHVRVYAMTTPIATLETSIPSRGLTAVATLANDEYSAWPAAPGATTRSEPGWTALAVHYPRFYMDYGGTATIHVYLRRFGTTTIAIMFMMTHDPRYTADGQPVDPILDVLRTVAAR